MHSSDIYLLTVHFKDFFKINKSYFIKKGLLFPILVKLFEIMIRRSTEEMLCYRHIPFIDPNHTS